MDCFILHIETATKVCSVALSKNGQLLFTKESDDSEYVHGEFITMFIEDVLNKANIKSQQLSAVSVTSGPGSYTGLRIGVSTAKGLCYALSIPLISIDSLLNLAFLGQLKYKDSTVCAMIDARRMEVFSAIYSHDLKLIKPISADIIDQNSYEEFEPFVVVGDGGSKLIDVWKERAIQIDSSIKSSAEGHVSIAFEKFQNNDFEDVAYFEPYYLKDFVGIKKN